MIKAENWKIKVTTRLKTLLMIVKNKHSFVKNKAD